MLLFQHYKISTLIAAPATNSNASEPKQLHSGSAHHYANPAFSIYYVDNKARDCMLFENKTKIKYWLQKYKTNISKTWDS